MSHYIQDGGVEGCVRIFSWENSKITTHCWTIVNRRILDQTKKDTPKKDTSESKGQAPERQFRITFRIKPHTHQRCLEGSNKTLCAPGDPTETEPDLPVECLSVSCGGVGH